MSCSSKMQEDTNSAQFNTFAKMWNTLIFEGKFKLSSAILALNIPRLGDKTSDKLANNPKDVEDMLGMTLGTNPSS